MQKKFIPVCEPTLDGNELKYVQECVTSNWISSAGKYTELFEHGFSKYCGVRYGIAVCNGNMALHLALEACEIGTGDEVIVPDFTMIASVNAVIYTGAKPVFIDADKTTWCINPTLIEAKITSRTKAIMAVHIYGHPCEMDVILSIAQKYKLLVIEDAAEAHGALYKGRKCGSMSDIAAFSFYANKIITTGEGGMVVTNNERLASRARMLKNYAFTDKRFISEEIGYNYRMTNIEAAIGCAQLERIEELVESRIRNAHIYSKLLAEVQGIITPPCLGHVKNVYWMYGILVTEQFGISSQELRKKLLDAGVDTRAFFIPMHMQPVYNKQSKKFPNLPDTTGDYPVSVLLGNNGFYLPSSSHLPEEYLRYIVDAIKDIQINH